MTFETSRFNMTNKSNSNYIQHQHSNSVFFGWWCGWGLGGGRQNYALNIYCMGLLRSYPCFGVQLWFCPCFLGFAFSSPPPLLLKTKQSITPNLDGQFKWSTKRHLYPRLLLHICPFSITRVLLYFDRRALL